ncbi:hypothetical protein [Streptomyces sp. NPDC058308]|uniref:hypothetical protein n=1 Tax=Streptomyces sp. NPDC058308 TaxID=3346440 RepID=UPI0036F013BE
MSQWDADNQRWVPQGPRRGQPEYEPPLQGPSPYGPQPTPPPDATAPSPGPPRSPEPDSVVTNPQRRLILSLIAIVVCAVLGVGTWLLVDRSSDNGSGTLSGPASPTATNSPTDAPTTETTDEPTTEPTATEPTASASSPVSDGGQPAPGYTRVEDEAGFTVDVRDGWQRTTRGASVFYTSLDETHFLQIFQLNGPESTPYDSAAEAKRLASQLPGFSPVSLNRQGPDTDSNAYLEYTYTNSQAGDRRIMDYRGTEADDVMYAVLVAAPVDERTTQFEILQNAVNSFCPTAYCTSP